jgi:hypothetical protein
MVHDERSWSKSGLKVMTTMNTSGIGMEWGGTVRILRAESGAMERVDSRQ